MRISEALHSDRREWDLGNLQAELRRGVRKGLLKVEELLFPSRDVFYGR